VIFVCVPAPIMTGMQLFFGLGPAGLGATACERVQDDNLRSRLHADRGRVLPGDEDSELMDERGRISRLLRIDELIFAIAKTCCNFGQIDPADSLVLYFQASIMEPDGVCRFRAVLPV